MKTINWRPTAALPELKLRAKSLALCRSFFDKNNVLEVETPLLCQHTVTDPHLNPIATIAGAPENRYLQTSPEFAMKRLLAAGSSDIFQICKAFRAGDQGHKHNPEFTIIEWYRLGFDHWQLIKEVDSFCQLCFGFPAAEVITYQELFHKYTQLNCHTATETELANFAKKQLDVSGLRDMSTDDWLSLILGMLIEPTLGEHRPTFIVDYPKSQAALARLCNPKDRRPNKTTLNTQTTQTDTAVAARFELFFRGVELGNGYWELTDSIELHRRLEHDNHQRLAKQLPVHEIDPYLMAAHDNGLPDCAGVALGLDRLLMALSGTNDISQLVSFDWPNA